MCNILKDQKGSSMILMVCIFLVLAVLGINLLNAANADISNTKRDYDKEQTMLYVSSIYQIVNQMIEDGDFSDSSGNLPSEVHTVSGISFQDAMDREISVNILFHTGMLPIQADVTITCFDSGGKKNSYTISGTYSRTGVKGKFVRETCRGVSDEISEP